MMGRFGFGWEEVGEVFVNRVRWWAWIEMF